MDRPLLNTIVLLLAACLTSCGGDTRAAGAIGVALAFGLNPAWRAANMDPVEALRHA